MSDDRPIFHPLGWRPARDEQREMKQAVIDRDGLTTCFWCRTPFMSVDDATLEHIMPLADGGMHDLRNCTLSCRSCNNRNMPHSFMVASVAQQADRQAKSAINRALNGGALDCDGEVTATFPSIARSFGYKPLNHAGASHLLKNIHRQINRVPPRKEEKHIFKRCFNRWLAMHGIPTPPR